MRYDLQNHNDVIKLKPFPRYWPFVRGIHRSPVNSRHKGKWRGALMFSLIWVWISSWINNREAGDFKRYRAHYDVIVMYDQSMNQFSSIGRFLLPPPYIIDNIRDRKQRNRSLSYLRKQWDVWIPCLGPLHHYSSVWFGAHSIINEYMNSRRPSDAIWRHTPWTALFGIKVC